MIITDDSMCFRVSALETSRLYLKRSNVIKKPVEIFKLVLYFSFFALLFQEKINPSDPFGDYPRHCQTALRPSTRTMMIDGEKSCSVLCRSDEVRDFRLFEFLMMNDRLQENGVDVKDIIVWI